MRRALPLLVLAAAATLSGCGGEELLHGLDEVQANEILVVLDDADLAAGKRREEGSDGQWTVSVGGRDAARARRILAERELPRPRPPGFGEVFGKGSMVPTPTEEHALYLHALAGELSRSVESIDGIVEARVHLGLPQPDPLRPGDRPPPRGAVLVKCRPASCEAVRALEPGIRALVAGAADGLEEGAVSVVIAPGAAARAAAAAPSRRSPLLLGLAALAGLGAMGLAGAAVRARLRGRGAP